MAMGGSPGGGEPVGSGCRAIACLPAHVACAAAMREGPEPWSQRAVHLVLLPTPPTTLPGRHGPQPRLPAAPLLPAVVLWELITGETPKRGEMRLPEVPAECPREAADLVTRCMSLEPRDRPTAQQLMQQLAAMRGRKRAGRGGAPA